MSVCSRSCILLCNCGHILLSLFFYLFYMFFLQIRAVLLMCGVLNDMILVQEVRTSVNYKDLSRFHEGKRLKKGDGTDNAEVTKRDRPPTIPVPRALRLVVNRPGEASGWVRGALIAGDGAHTSPGAPRNEYVLKGFYADQTCTVPALVHVNTVEGL